MHILSLKKNYETEMFQSKYFYRKHFKNMQNAYKNDVIVTE